MSGLSTKEKETSTPEDLETENNRLRSLCNVYKTALEKIMWTETDWRIETDANMEKVRSIAESALDRED